ncbi:MAG: ATP-binding cassette domain-containing protein [Chitinophagaceae bacterium]|nr:ATP-binding cassette domain-containing protein [Chitinophagaceae bacterium]
MKTQAIKRILDILRFEKKEISAIYFYAIFSGLVQLSLPLGIQSIISFVVGGAISTSLVLLIIFVVAGVFITGLLQVNQMKIIEKIQQQLFVRYSFLYSYNLPKLNLSSVDRYYLPELVNRFFDTVSLQKSLAKLMLDIPLATIQILFGLILLSFYHPVFIFFGISLLLIVFLILRFTSNKGLETSIEESNYKYQVAGWLQEMARVISSFKFSSSSNLHLYKTDEQVNGYLKARTSHFKILLLQYWSLIAFKVLITAAMLIVGTFLLLDQQLNIGQFIAAEIVIITVMSAVEKLVNNLDKVYDVLTSVEKLGHLTDKPLEESGDYIPETDTSMGMRLQVNNLNFGYDKNRNVLQNLSFEVKAGEKICISGNYGSGKSTLLKVLTGTYQPYEGVITFDGISLPNYNKELLRLQTGILFDSLDIFEGTLLENITMGREDISVKYVMEMAARVGLKDFIESLPEGFALQLHPTGKRLPGKIVTKILLLRALVGKPRLLLLEEPFLGLEEKYVQQVQDLLIKDLKTTTVIVVTNDKSFAVKCDKVVVLENGVVVSDSHL